MPAARTLLPDQAPEEWVKPTLSNTLHGKSYKPTHPTLFQVEFSSPTGTVDQGKAEKESAMEEGFTSRLVAVREFKPYETLTNLTNISLAPEKAYSSVQFGTGSHDHLELNSDLLFMNHSCAPTAEVVLPHLKPDEWIVRAGSAGLKQGQDITFFYPSTEWDMAQGFDCACGAKTCLGKIRGAKYLSIEQLESISWVNEHIRTLKSQQPESK